MKLNTSILPLRQGTTASIELSQDKWSVVLSLQSPFGKKRLALTQVLDTSQIPRGGLPTDTMVVGVQQWVKGPAFDERGLTKDGALLYTFDLEIMIDNATGSNPYVVKVTFEILADQWEFFFNPETFKETT